LALSIERLDVSDNMRILDLGCGTGNILQELLQDHPHLVAVGVDGSPTMLRQARKKLRQQVALGTVTLIQDDVMAFLRHQTTASYDRIIMVNLIYALPDREGAWRECLRILKPAGKIVATTSDRSGSRQIVAEHLKHDHWWKLLSLRLVATGIIDHFINEFARVDIFQFPNQKKLLGEVAAAGGSYDRVTRCYGGVNILFAVRHAP